jgi:hypothetical protein
MAKLGSTQFVCLICPFSRSTDVCVMWTINLEGCSSFISNMPALVGSLNFIFVNSKSPTLANSCLVLRLCTYVRNGGRVYMELEISGLYYALHLVSLCAGCKHHLSLEHLKKTRYQGNAPDSNILIE